MKQRRGKQISGFLAEMSDQSRCLPPIIWTEILRKLPPKILGQCRCVCKSWDSLIVSPAFLAAHLKCYTQNESNTLLLYKHVSKPPLKKEEYTIFSESAANLDTRYSFTCPLLPKKFFRIIGSLNGLLLLMDEAFGHGTLLVLWNPLIKRYIILPPPKTTSDRGTSKEFMSIFGLGYDSRIDDHKVVHLLYIQGADGLDVTPPVVELYSVQKGVWSEPLAVNFDHICICRCWWSQCFIKGSIHWIAWERDHKTYFVERNCLLLFDVEQEKFKKMKLPEDLNKANALNLRVSDYGGRLSVIYSLLTDGVAGKQTKSFEVWVKKEYNDSSSWCKMIGIMLSQSSCLKFVQYLRKGGEQVLGFSKKGELLCCDLHPPQTKRLGLRGRQRSWFTFDYSESLVLLDKKHGVYSYDASCHRKKRYAYVIKNGSPTVMEEQADDNNNGEDQSAGIFEHPRYKELVHEQLVRMHGGTAFIDFVDIINVEGENTDTLTFFRTGED